MIDDYTGILTLEQKQKLLAAKTINESQNAERLIYCTLLNKMIDETYCYEINLVVNRIAKPSMIEDRFDRDAAEHICNSCKFRRFKKQYLYKKRTTKKEKPVKYHQNLFQDAFRIENEMLVMTAKGLEKGLTGDWVLTDWIGIKTIVEHRLFIAMVSAGGFNKRWVQKIDKKFHFL